MGELEEPQSSFDRGHARLPCQARIPPPNLLRFPSFDEGGDLASTAVANSNVHAERVVTLVNQSLQLFIVANDENYALAA